MFVPLTIINVLMVRNVPHKHYNKMLEFTLLGYCLRREATAYADTADDAALPVKALQVLPAI